MRSNSVKRLLSLWYHKLNMMQPIRAFENIIARNTEQRSQRNAYSRALASVGMRCCAFLIDYILTLLILAIPLVLGVYMKRRMFPSWSTLLMVIVGYLTVAAFIFFNWIYIYVKNKQSFGKTYLGLRVIRLDGQPMTYKTAAMRHVLGYPLSILCFGIGVLNILWDKKQQGLHDKIAGTIVVKD